MNVCNKILELEKRIEELERERKLVYPWEPYYSYPTFPYWYEITCNTTGTTPIWIVRLVRSIDARHVYLVIKSIELKENIIR